LAFGWGKWLFPVLLFSWGIILYKKDRTYIRTAGILGVFLALLSIEALFHIAIPWTNGERRLIKATAAALSVCFLLLFLSKPLDCGEG
jgi:hypothetical protein